MVEFNSDGSLKLPDWINKQKQEHKNKLKTQRCIKIERKNVSDTSPKSCLLLLTLSEAFSDNRFVENIYNYFKEKAEVPSKLIKINEKEFQVEIGTCFRRCSDCCSLVKRFREHVEGNFIEIKGSCSYETRQQNFCYEDYFD